MADDIENEPIAHPLIREAIWEKTGYSGEALTAPVWVGDCEIPTTDLHELVADELMAETGISTDDISSTELRDLALRTIRIFSATGVYGKVFGYDAFQLEDHIWYVERHDSSEGTGDEFFLAALVPHRSFDEFARDVVDTLWTEEGFSDYSAPDVVESDFANEVWFIREIALFGSSRVWEFAGEKVRHLWDRVSLLMTWSRRSSENGGTRWLKWSPVPLARQSPVWLTGLRRVSRSGSGLKPWTFAGAIPGSS